MKLVWLALAAVLASYAAVVSIFPFEGPLGLTVHFTRLTITIAATIVIAVIYIQMIPGMLKGEYSRSVSYLFTAMGFFLFSLVCFSFWNEAGRIFHVNTNVLTGFIPGGFSVLAIIASVFALLSTGTENVRLKIIALAVGMIISACMIFVTPQFH